MQVTTRGPQTAADWTAQNPVLDQFEIGIEVDPATGAYGRFKIGDGRSAWNSLSYAGGSASSSVPATSSATGTAGSIAYDSSYIYVCVATNTWERVAISTW